MSVEQDIFLIGVTGSRKNVVRMLNAAIRNVADGNPIVESDDIETINHKLNYFIGREGHSIGIFDLFDEECLRDEAVSGKKEAFDNRVNNPFDAQDAHAEPDRYIEVVRVEEGENGYTAKFSWYLYDCYGPTDWADWDDIARLYDCRVFVDDNYYRNGEFVGFECATVYEPGGGNRCRFEAGTTGKEQDDFMHKLAELYPERYSPILKRYLKEKEDEEERQRLEEERHIKLNRVAWKRFASWEEDGINAIRGVYDGLFDAPHIIPAEEVLNVLKVRAEKWKGIIDEFAECYEELILRFNEYCKEALKKREDATMGTEDYKWIDSIVKND